MFFVVFRNCALLAEGVYSRAATRSLSALQRQRVRSHRIAKDSESLRELVVYRALYGERGLWVRSLEMFTEIVERDGQRMPRFQYVGDVSA